MILAQAVMTQTMRNRISRWLSFHSFRMIKDTFTTSRPSMVNVLSKRSIQRVMIYTCKSMRWSASSHQDLQSVDKTSISWMNTRFLINLNVWKNKDTSSRKRSWTSRTKIDQTMRRADCSMNWYAMTSIWYRSRRSFICMMMNHLIKVFWIWKSLQRWKMQKLPQMIQCLKN